MTDYTTVALPTQAALIDQTVQLGSYLEAAAQLWENGGQQLQLSAASFGQHIDDIDAAWLDAGGNKFVDAASQSKSTMDSWHSTISGSNLAPMLRQIAQVLPQTQQTVHQNLELWLMALKAIGGTKGGAGGFNLQAYQQAAGQAMNQVATLFQKAQSAAGTIQSAPQWSGPTSGGGSGSGSGSGSSGSGSGAAGGGAAGGGGSGQSASASSGGDDGGASSQSSASGDTASAGGLGDDPSLAGGVAAPPVTVPDLPPIPPPSTPDLSSTGAFLPPPVGMGGGFTPAGGMSVGGPRSIPRAAPTVASSPEPVSRGAAPVAPAEEAVGAPQRGGEAGGAPMMPMGGMGGGLGGASERPGSGAAARVGGGRGARPVAPLGIPALLRGKSGGRSTFQPLSRRRPPADEATDDDLWQLDR